MCREVAVYFPLNTRMLMINQWRIGLRPEAKAIMADDPPSQSITTTVGTFGLAARDLVFESTSNILPSNNNRRPANHRRRFASLKTRPCLRQI